MELWNAILLLKFYRRSTSFFFDKKKSAKKIFSPSTKKMFKKQNTISMSINKRVLKCLIQLSITIALSFEPFEINL